MKELSIEEKAQRFDEAINKAKSKIKNDKDHVLYEDEDKNLTITFYPKCMNYTNGGYDYVCIRCGCVTIEELPIDCVHQLHHALRLCGIAKEIKTIEL